MIIKPIKTRVLVPPKDDLFSVLAEALPRHLPEQCIVTVTSKIVSIGEGRCVPTEKVKNKDRLIRQEALKYLPRDYVKGRWVIHTLHHNLLIPSAGIDESNANNHYILWPKNPKRSARKIHAWLRKTYRLEHVGVIITDSHSIPLRRGTVGISLAYHGFMPLHDYRRTTDIFGRQLKITQSNVVDGLAAAAVVTQGEGNEVRPIALISNVPFVSFGTRKRAARAKFSSLEVDMKEDLYYPFIGSVPWRKGGAHAQKRV